FAAMEAYDSIYVLAKAVEMAESAESDAVVAALEKIEYPGVLGTIYFSK
ncbi:MAG: ABC transporter substrate-binding protein, partial [Deltaproteobacteria bacterium]|nr:ABC transporter substrate-binding protein [Deltaproteobacteria bacterium]